MEPPANRQHYLAVAGFPERQKHGAQPVLFPRDKNEIVVVRG